MAGKGVVALPSAKSPDPIMSKAPELALRGFSLACYDTGPFKTDQDEGAWTPAR